jgi:predicted nucleotidyltransferase
MNRKEVIQSIKDIIRAKAPDATIILYGSEARGDSRDDSDIDLLILVDREALPYNDIREITYPLYDIELASGVLISPLVYTKKQWYDRPFKTPFYINIMNEGIRL